MVEGTIYRNPSSLKKSAVSCSISLQNPSNPLKVSVPLQDDRGTPWPPGLRHCHGWSVPLQRKVRPAWSFLSFLVRWVCPKLSKHWRMVMNSIDRDLFAKDVLECSGRILPMSRCQLARVKFQFVMRVFFVWCHCN